MKPLLICSGEPSGVGPDLCLALAGLSLPVVVLCDKAVLQARAEQLGLSVILVDYRCGEPLAQASRQLTVLSIPCPKAVVAGMLNPDNAGYVMALLTAAISRCLAGEFGALVTAPVHKAILNQSGVAFTGHTEFFAGFCKVPDVVMLLACSAMKVALITTHIPLKDVSNRITQSLVTRVVTLLHQALRSDFGIETPKILVAGLNPHAGEEGYLGREDQEIITPAIACLRAQGMDVTGPWSADTMFVPGIPCDAFVAMYHDQGLPVLKYAGFGSAVNITLGLPIIRTSVDHGTALLLAGTGKARADSLLAAVSMAQHMMQQRAARHVSA